MSKRPYHRRFHSDAISGYMGLSLEERGGYSTLLDYLYDRGEPLPDNMRLIAGYLDVSVRKAVAVVDSLVSKGKITRLSDGRLTNKRFEKEVENDAKTSDHMAEIGKNGGDKSAEVKKLANKIKDRKSPPLKRSSSLPLPLPYPEDKKERLLVENDFETWYKIYPRKIDRRDAERAYAKAVSQTTPAVLLAAVKIFAASVQFKEPKFIPHPATWLNKGRWQSEEISSDPKAALAARIRAVLKEDPEKMVRNFTLTFGDNLERAAAKLDEFAADRRPIAAANNWFFQHGAEGCAVGTVM